MVDSTLCECVILEVESRALHTPEGTLPLSYILSPFINFILSLTNLHLAPKLALQPRQAWSVQSSYLSFPGS